MYNIYIYIYIYMCVCVRVYIYIYIYIWGRYTFYDCSTVIALYHIFNIIVYMAAHKRATGIWHGSSVEKYEFRSCAEVCGVAWKFEESTKGFADFNTLVTSIRLDFYTLLLASSSKEGCF